MPLVIADRVRETSTTTGTGTLTLDGAVTGFRTFSSAIGDTNTCYYTITLGSDWEVGVGTVGAGTLARTTILKSSNSNNAVNFGAGTKDVFVTYPAERAVYKDDAGNINAAAGIQYVYKTANYTASNNEGVLTNTSGGAFTVTLPATPSTGAQVIVADAGAAWGTNNLTISRNGSTIGGLAENLVCDITGVSVQLVYDGTTWEVYAQAGGVGGNYATTGKAIAMAIVFGG